VLVIFAGFLRAQTYEVTNCDFVFMRAGPGGRFPKVQRLQVGVNGIILIGNPVWNGPDKWQQVNSRGVIGWVHSDYLRESIPLITQVTAPTPLPTPQSTPTPVVVSPSTSTNDNDCLIVATEMHARLKPSAHWVRICIFRMYKNGEYAYSHAIVLYQPTPTSNVFFYDKDLGSMSTGTNSQDLNEIIYSLNYQLKKGVTIGDPRWVD
jgi:uncharacterized protein YraI